MTFRLKTVLGATALVLMSALAAQAETVLKWAHVYETSEPFHTESVWAGEEIAKRTNNKYQIEVFAASALGNEQQINQALPLGTIDMIYTGTSFAGATHKPLAISGAPGMVRDYNHWSTIGVLNELLPLPDNRITLADETVSAATLGLMAIGGPSYDLPRFVHETAEAVRASGKPCAVHAPDPRVRQAFAAAGLPVFASERAALVALRDWRRHVAAIAASARHDGACRHA